MRNGEETAATRLRLRLRLWPARWSACPGELNRSESVILFHMRMRTVLLSLIAASALAADDKSALLQKMDAHAVHYGEISRKIWEFAEVGYKENKSAELL